MTRLFSVLAFVTGAALIISMTGSIVADDRLTLLVMLLIAGVYVVGVIELFLYQRDTQGLDAALASVPSRDGEQPSSEDISLDTWLERVPSNLRQSVKARLLGEESMLPAPTLAPYLTGLLVMLGLMGTFVGMVATLGGAVQALEGGTELSAIRQGLTAPIQGLGMAFGTSVAGVGASAMLGLMAALSRRDRLLSARALAKHRDGYFRHYSARHKQEETYSAIVQQAAALPDVVASLSVLSEQLGALGSRVSELAEQSTQQSFALQKRLEQGVREDFRQLTGSVAETLESRLTHSGKQAADILQPQISAILEQATQQFTAVSQQHSVAMSQLSDVLLSRQKEHGDAQQQFHQEWRAQLEHDNQRLLQTVTDEVQQLAAVERQRSESSAAYFKGLSVQLSQGLEAVIEKVSQQHLATSEAMSQQWSDHQQSLSQQWQASQGVLESRFSSMTESLQASMSELITVTTGASQANAKLILQLEQQVSVHRERDNVLLAERKQLMEELAALSEGFRNSTELQQQMMEQVLEQSGENLIELGNSVGQQLSQSGEQLSGAAVELSTLSHAFADAVDGFKTSTEEMQTVMAGIADTMTSAGERSDEQMGYYVSQAREIIDHNLMTQQAILERLEGALSGAASS